MFTNAALQVLTYAEYLLSLLKDNHSNPYFPKLPPLKGETHISFLTFLARKKCSSTFFFFQKNTQISNVWVGKWSVQLPQNKQKAILFLNQPVTLLNDWN